MQQWSCFPTFVKFPGTNATNDCSEQCVVACVCFLMMVICKKRGKSREFELTTAKMSARSGKGSEMQVVFLGASGTGAKTSLLRRLLTGTFDPAGTHTVGAAYLVLEGKLDGAPVTLNAWGLPENT